MTVHVRGIEPDEQLDVCHNVFTCFGSTWNEEEGADECSWLDADRVLVADDDGRRVGQAAAHTFEMSVPGGARLPVAGVTWVGVLPTHRRRGIVTSMMRRQLDDVAARGEPIAILTASEASIYGRFGYGLATRLAKVRIDTSRPLELWAEPEGGGRFRLVDAAEAEPDARRVVDELLATRVGELTRPDAWWPAFHKDREDSRKGASARFWVVHESATGAVDGVAHYRIKERWGGEDAVPRNEVQLGDAWTTDPEVEAALLVYLAGIDLTTSITTWARPVDDPFRLRVVDDRRYRVELHHDHLYVRLLDIPAALSARTYEHAGDEPVVLGVDDRFRPQGSGRYRVAKGECERVGDLHDGDADAFLGVDALGCLYLGDVTARQLAAAGRLRPSSDRGLDAVDRLFRTPSAPFCTMEF